jgi:microcystin degradation protein MlrC
MKGAQVMRIAICGFGIESTMFTLQLAHYRDFVIFKEDALVARYPLADWLGAEKAASVEWIGTMYAFAGAHGPVAPDDYDAIEEEIVSRLRAAGPVDGVYVDMHGAGHVQGRTHLEEGLLRRIRDVVGDDCVISMSMDPHGNFSEELASLIDFSTTHRHSPHIDNWETRRRSVVNLMEILERGEKPLKAWIRIPVLLPGERSATTAEPGASVFLAAIDAAKRPGVLDTGIWVGFAWADEDRNAAAVMVTGWDAQSITETAAELAQRFWDAREEFKIVIDHSGSWSEALDFIASSPPTPIWISDSGDNVTAGASGDVTYPITETLARPEAIAGKKVLFAGICDPDTLDAAVAAGVGAILDRSLGAIVDSRFAPPVPGPWTVVELIDGMFGEGMVGAVLDNGMVHVSVHRIRIKFTSLDDPTLHPRPGQVWHDLSSYDVIVVKNGYMFPGQEALAASKFMALTPGGTDLDFDRLPFHELWRPMFPMDRNFEADLTPKLLPVTAKLPA